jgi:hypothetical protein
VTRLYVVTLRTPGAVRTLRAYGTCTAEAQEAALEAAGLRLAQCDAITVEPTTLQLVLV